jgi:4'-phosphopantetheinyl transferase
VNDPVAITLVWLADLDACGVALAECERATPRLSDDDLARAGPLVDPVSNARRLSAAIALRVVLERTFGPSMRGVALPRERLGRPALPEGFAGAFSLSHCGGLVLIGVTTAGRIGVDLEVRRELRMAERRQQVIIAAAETLVRDGLPGIGTDRFLQAWVVLEALAKADGRGIGHLLTRLGAVGGRDGRSDAAEVMARELGVKLCVLDVGAGRFGAVVADGVVSSVTRFPDTVAGINEMVAG